MEEIDCKASLRAACLRARRAQPPDVRATRSGQIVRRLLSLPEWRAASVVCCYLSVDTEVQTAAIIAAAHAEQIHVAVPIVAPPGIAEIRADTTLCLGPHGMWQPEAIIPVPVEAVDLWIVPGVAFGRDGSRLGRGGGYYDRLLARARGTVIGLAFDLQVIDRLPVDPWDRGVDRIVTESGVIVCPSGISLSSRGRGQGEG